MLIIRWLNAEKILKLLNRIFVKMEKCHSVEDMLTLFEKLTAIRQSASNKKVTWSPIYDTQSHADPIEANG